VPTKPILLAAEQSGLHRLLEEPRDAGVRYVLITGGGSGARGHESLRRFAQEIMPMFPDKPA
jgi:hypothetical protein